MTQEEKAKAYDEALEKARKRVAVEPQDHTDAILKDIFPQLRESEDERMRRKTINCLIMHNKGCVDAKDIEECISWLEKQKESHVPWYDYQKSKEAGYTIVPNEEYEQLIKQKEQKPAWSEEDVKRLYSIGTQIGFLKGKYSEYQKDIDWLHALAEKMGFHKCKTGEIVTEWKKEDIDDKMLSKPKQEWSEEDNEMFHCICAGLCHLRKLYETNKDAVSDYNAMLEWFRNCFKSFRPSWKPSEEQMEELWNAISYIEKPDSNFLGVPALLETLYEQLKKL